MKFCSALILAVLLTPLSAWSFITVIDFHNTQSGHTGTIIAAQDMKIDQLRGYQLTYRGLTLEAIDLIEKLTLNSQIKDIEYAGQTNGSDGTIDFFVKTRKWQYHWQIRKSDYVQNETTYQ